MNATEAPVDRLTLAPEPASARLARQWLGSRLHGWPPDAVETAELLVTELVTNAVLHAGSTIEVGVELSGDRIRIEVADRSPALPTTKDYGVAAATGRGLHLIAALASAWGVEEAPGGKVVWFVLDRELGAAPEPIAFELDAWPDLAEAIADLGGPSAPDPAALGAVDILGLPVPLLRDATMHSEALVREFRLIAERDPGDADDVPVRLLDLMARLEGRFTSFTQAEDAALADALERGVPVVDVHYRLPVEAGVAADELDGILEEADEFCRHGDLLTLAAPPPAAAFRRWFLREFARQLRGEPPCAWPDGPEASEVGQS